MNIYLLIEDSESFCIKAKTMSDAVILCEENYLEEREEEEGERYDMKVEKDYYYREILQSCSLVGELKN